MGLHFPVDHPRALESKIRGAAREFGFENGDAFLEWVLSSPAKKSQIELLAGFLTVGETTFFRDGDLFEFLEKRLFPELIASGRAKGKRLAIWSAGCSTGEEPYSIAMLLRKMIGDPGEWDISILATDVNPHFLRKAAEGLYGAWSFRGVPTGLQRKFFKKTPNGRFEINREIRRMVKFLPLNLAADDAEPPPFGGEGALDLIFCRNVLMYFTREGVEKVVRGFHRSLAEGAFLVLGGCEGSFTSSAPFVLVEGGAPVYAKRKRGAPAGNLFPGAREAPALPPPSPPPRSFEPPGPRPREREFQPRRLELPRENPPPETGREPDLYLEAAALYEGGRYEEAAKTAERALGVRADDAGSMALLARIHADTGRLDEAIGWCEKAAAAGKLDAGVHYLMATILDESGRAEAAVESLKRAVYLDPELIAAHMALGNISRRLGKAADAARHFRNALSLLAAEPPERVLPEAGGITAGRLTEMIRGLPRKGDKEAAE
jgi:chemotaxis protein methyltransferase CheR